MIGETISRYQILEKLGEGGMGIVYKARDTRLDRLVAIKFLPSHVDASEETKARFLQEARSVAAINHPNVMSIYEIDERDGKSFLVMEYVDGQTLKDRLAATRSGEGVSRRAALEWALEIAKGLKAAHDKGIVHRDIKSENIMFTTAGQVKVMDFGLAKARGNPGITRAGSSLGTLSYMSPEQMQGIPADHRTDIWSFGVLLYEMLTGELPFKAEHDAALLYLITGEDPPVPSALDRRIPNSVDSLVMKLLRKNRADRASHIDEVIDELTRLLSDADGVTAATRKKAIAVLPFNNISPDKESDYFADGLTEELIANLSRLKEMRVLSRTTSMGYRGTGKDIKTIGRELGTRYILEGSVRKFQDNLRITAQLIDVESDEQLWAETYKGQLADVFDIQEQVSKQIVDALMVKLSPTEKVVLTKRSTMNAEAFDCCLRARNFLYRLTKNNVHLAIQLFQRAIELDPRYASAYAGLGEAYATMYQYFEAAEIWLDRAIESSLKALMYDSSLSEAYAALGLAYFDKKSIDEAVTATRKSIELDPEQLHRVLDPREDLLRRPTRSPRRSTSSRRPWS